CGGHKKQWKHWVAGTAAFALLALGVAQVFLAVERAKGLSTIGKAPTQRLITITGLGKVKALPDIASVNLGHQIERRDVRSAQLENTTKMNAMRATLRKLGIADADVQTADYSIYPQYDYKDGQQSLRGYLVTQSLSVKIRDLEKISTVLDEAGSLGLNQVGGIQFTIDDPEKLRQEARTKALAQAKEKASTLATVMGVRLGGVVSFSEDAGGPTPPPVYFSEKAMGMGGAVPDIAPGSLDVTVTAYVQYEIE
ncbi:SIMPL domain-containing protein, partial [Candidatus Uhrbacteria bacterium]|nr:SIMPL domain-containing protein [Candidatus Uhrbacteria bacterium]